MKAGRHKSHNSCSYALSKVKPAVTYNGIPSSDGGENAGGEKPAAIISAKRLAHARGESNAND